MLEYVDTPLKRHEACVGLSSLGKYLFKVFFIFLCADMFKIASLFSAV